MNSRAPLSPEEVLRRVRTIGNYYGFTPFPTLALQARSTRPKRQPYPSEIQLETFDPMAQIVVSFLKQLRDAGVTPSIKQPLFVWHTNITPGRKAPKQVTIQFHVLGVAHAIADIVLIRATQALISDLFKEKPGLRINSIGDRETRARFARELTQYFQRKNAVLPADCIECAKRDIFEAAGTLVSHMCTEDLPSSVDYLSEASRKHFESVLEFLEDIDTSYSLTPELITRDNAWAETCFEMNVGDERVAWGSRYNEITGSFFDESVPSATMLIRITTHRRQVLPIRKQSKPKVVFLHIGDEAKRVSIRLTEEMRRARLSVTQMIGVESLMEQMRLAEEINPPYLLIIGRKEALDGTAILRELSTHTETVIPIESLIKSLQTV